MTTFFFLLEADGTIRSVDQAGLSALGYAKEELIGKKLVSFLGEGGAKAFIERKLSNKGTATDSHPTLLIGKTGSRHGVELSFSNVPRRAGGNPVYACVATLVAPATSEEPGLIRHISHELNNTLVAVKGYAQMISRDPSASDSVKEYAGEIFKAAARIQAISDQLRANLAPANKAAARPRPAPGPTLPAEPIRPITAITKKALIVEDDIAIAEVLKYYVKDFFEIAIESDPAKALEEISHATYDLIITDLKMPRISGNQILARARERQPKTPVIVVSGLHRESPEAKEVLAAGAAEFLEKPFLNMDAVRAVLRKYAA